MHIRLRPIRILCFHKVSEEYDPKYGGFGDWMEVGQFKQTIKKLKKKYKFISITQAKKKLEYDKFRFKRYAVLTCDDGYQCVLKLLPWLEKEKVPITLFLSVGYFDGISYDPWFDNHWKKYPNTSKEKLLSGMYIQNRHMATPQMLSQNVTLALHGFGHDEVSTMSKDTFSKYVDKCVSILKGHPRYQSFYAYTWGHYSMITDEVLHNKGIVPVYCDGSNNRKYDGALHRIILE